MTRSGPQVAPVVALAALVVAVFAAWWAWQSQDRIAALEQELVRRQQSSQELAAEARTLSRQAQEVSRDAAAKAALLETRVAEVALQRTQLEDLIQSLSRSRDENLITDIDASLRVALQQTAITGSAEPLVAALRSADERLVRVNQPRLEGVRRAIARDLDRTRAVGVADIAALTVKLDEVVRLADELPLIVQVAPVAQVTQGAAPSTATSPARRAGTSATAPAPAPASAPKGPDPAPWQTFRDDWQRFGDRVWNEARSLVRVTRIDQPEAMLIAPEQAWFLRENFKLKLLNARLALLSRQFETAHADLLAASTSISRYFDAGSRKTQAAADLLRQVATQSRQAGVPRPDDTLAALAAAVAGR